MEKNSFILYTDYLTHINQLSNEQAGLLLKAIMSTVAGCDTPDMDALTTLAYSFIMQDIEHNNEKYAEMVKARSEAGKKGASVRWNGKNGKAKNRNGKNDKAKNRNGKNALYDNDNDNVNDNENDNGNDNNLNNTECCVKEKVKKEKYYPNDPELDKAFCDFVEMRKKIKAPLSTERAIALSMNKLQKLSGGDNDLAIEILNQSIMNSWKGLFELHKPRSDPDKPISIAEKWKRAAELAEGG